MSIDEMPAGQEFDALVAERVMGWTLEPVMKDTWQDANGHYVACAEHWHIGGNDDLLRWSPSTDIAAAWQVMEKMLQGKECISFLFAQALCYGGPTAGLDNVYLRRWDGDMVVSYVLNVLRLLSPLAICRAALKAVQENDK